MTLKAVDTETTDRTTRATTRTLKELCVGFEVALRFGAYDA